MGIAATSSFQVSEAEPAAGEAESDLAVETVVLMFDFQQDQRHREFRVNPVGRLVHWNRGVFCALPG
jgi:hypothetical protein